MKTPEYWQRYMSLGIPSAEAPRGHGCIPLELIDVVGFWAPPPESQAALTSDKDLRTATLGEAPVTAEMEALRLEMKRKLEARPLKLERAFDSLSDSSTTLRWPERLRQAYETRESDPKGFDPHQPGAKLDAGKVRMGLVMRGFTRALFEVGRVGTYGAGKYTPNGWLEVENGEERYMDAAYRHLAEDELNPFDTSAALFHLAQAAWNLLAVLELRLREMER